MSPRQNVLITGINGFSGKHLAKHCLDQGSKVTGIGRSSDFTNAGEIEGSLSYVSLDMYQNRDELEALVKSEKPYYIFHLAALASVHRSWDNPDQTISINVGATKHLLDAVLEHTPQSKIVVSCTGEQYGPVDASDLPVTENQPSRPQNPYALSKAETDLICGYYSDIHGLNVVRARAFNHIGPGQRETYVAASFAKQIAEAERSGLDSVEIVTGNIDAKRDFTDVRDIAKAYWLLAETADAGTYNVCSGKAISIGELLKRLSECTDLDVTNKVDPQLLRKNEVMEIRGSYNKLRRATGWQPLINLEQTLEETLDWWRQEIGRTGDN